MYVDSIMIRGAWNYWQETAHRSLGRARRPLSLIISWRSIPIIPGQFTSMCISSRVLLSQNEPCRRQIGSIYAEGGPHGPYAFAHLSSCGTVRESHRQQ